MTGRVYVAGTCDTKGRELRFVRDLVAAEGMPTCLVDLSTGGAGGDADVSAAEVAAHHPDGAAAVFTRDRGAAVGAMAEAFRRFAASRSDMAGLLCHGGPIAMPEDARFVLARCPDCHGFYGASSMERLPTEQAILAQTRDFKALRREAAPAGG